MPGIVSRALQNHNCSPHILGTFRVPRKLLTVRQTTNRFHSLSANYMPSTGPIHV